ncbi:MAG: glycosyltransferase [Thermoanaerobaculia bacterium]
MRLALLTYRFPWPVHTGDRVRAVRWLDAMLPLGEVTLIAPDGALPDAYRAVRHLPLRRSAGALLTGLARVAANRLPLHVLTAGAYDWRTAIRRGESEGRFDAAVVLLSRCDPWTGELRSGRRVMDAIDASSLSIAMRSRSANGSAASRFWRRESKRSAILEASFSSKYDCVMVVNDRERQLFGERAIAVGSGVRLQPVTREERDFDFGFWGRLEYFVNSDAVRELLDVIWPSIRCELPEARLLIAGADVPPFIRAWDGRSGITVMSPFDDRAALLRRVKVAIFPLRNGTGVSNKILEAGEASCAIVATPEALSGLDDLRPAVVLAQSDAELAASATSLARDPQRARRLGEELRHLVERQHDASSSEERLRAVLTTRSCA